MLHFWKPVGLCKSNMTFPTKKFTKVSGQTRISLCPWRRFPRAYQGQFYPVWALLWIPNEDIEWSRKRMKKDERVAPSHFDIRVVESPLQYLHPDFEPTPKFFLSFELREYCHVCHLQHLTNKWASSVANCSSHHLVLAESQHNSTKGRDGHSLNLLSFALYS